MEHIYIDYQIYEELKSNRYKLASGIQNFKIEELDDGVIFFDEDYNYIDPERFEFENIKIKKVLIPRFIWDEFYDKLNTFRVLLPQENKNIEFLDMYKMDQELKEKYQITKLEPKFEMKFQPRDNQLDSINAILNRLKENKTLRGILKGLPGIGKTFLSIYTAQYFNKVMIIVPKDVLVDQWIEEILSFTKLDRSQIIELQGSKIKDIEEVTDPKYKIVISKPQSLLSQIKRIPYLDLVEYFSCFDFVIFDEAHNAGALGYSKALSLFKTPNIFGVTATPYRKGLNEFLLRTSIGEVFYEAEAEVLTPEVTIQVIPQEKIPYTEKELKTLNMKRNDYIQFLTFFNMFLAYKKEYFEYLSEWVAYYQHFNHKSVLLFNTIKMINAQKKAIENNPKLKDKMVLALTGNSKKDALNLAKEENKKLKEELKLLKEELDLKVKNKELRRKDANEILKEERQKSKELQELNIEKSLLIYKQKIKDADIILGTYGLLREGFDKPELSHVIFGSPVIGKTSLIQVLGRITRLADNKAKPVAQFFLHEIFLNQNKHAIKTIQNNIKNDYPEAEIKFL